MDSQLARFQLLTRSPLWAIRPEALVFLFQMVLRPAAGRDVGGRWEAAKPTVTGSKTNKLAIIPIEGVLTKDGPAWWGSNYDTISSAVEQAGADANIKRVVLSVDSPGGEVTGLPETAALVAQLAKVKHVSAIVNGMSASAAYWLTSQANDITATPSGEVGSVGVRMMHVDVTKMLEDVGYKVTELFSGAYKTEWSPYHALTDEAKADMQARLDSVHADFLSAVAAGRKTATEDIKAKRFGEGRMFDARVAMTHGMVDKMMSARDFMRSVMPMQEEEPVPQFGLRERARAVAVGKAKV